MSDTSGNATENTESILRAIRDSITRGEQRFTVHAQAQMAVRHVTSTEIIEALLSESAEIIENYPEDKYSPSCLIYAAIASGRELHIQSNHRAVIVTVYEPDPGKWDNLKRRRKLS